MRHYEIIFLVHPDQSDQVSGMLDRYRALVEEEKGTIHRLEDWGRRPLAYPIQKIYKAHYVLLNIECTPATLEALCNMFRFNDAVLRNMVVACDSAITEPSVMLKKPESKDKENTKPKSSSEDESSSKDAA